MGARLALLALAGCGDRSSSDIETGGADDDTVAVTLRFAARAGDTSFDCGGALEGLGTTSSAFAPLDLRFYTHDFTLLADDGREEPLDLTPDGMWQVEDLALLDFEDASGTCANGTPETNAVVTGRSAPGDWTGLRFSLGVPFELNHQDASLAASPLNLSSLFWGWSGGYKFLRLDGATDGIPGGAIFHLGSTGCTADDDGDITGCSAENVATITLTGFDPDASVVVLDLATLFEAVNLDEDAGGAELCMSSETDPECGLLFAALGLELGETSGDPPTQRAFRVD